MVQTVYVLESYFSNIRTVIPHQRLFIIIVPNISPQGFRESLKKILKNFSKSLVSYRVTDACSRVKTPTTQ